jgi:hypothetical protein
MRCCKDLFSYCSQSDTKGGYFGKCPTDAKGGELGQFQCECIYLLPNSIENPLIITKEEQAKFLAQKDKKKARKEKK